MSHSDKAWEDFLRTGTVEHYLRYKSRAGRMRSDASLPGEESYALFDGWNRGERKEHR